MVSPQSKTTTYRYDAVGNRDSVISPNGTTSGYLYDNLNRLTRVRHYKAGTILAHFAYTLNAAGIRTQVTEKDSSKAFYGYDSLYRLKSERRTGNHTDTMTYTYDPVGNRLTKVHRGVTTSYTYNNRDQLLSEWDGTDSTRYSYDSAGRTLTKLGTGGTTHYRWRDEDRLDSLYGPSVSVKYQYDADGRRVKDSTGSTVRQYLIDPLLPYGQVIAETDGSNSPVAEYVYGTDRVSQRRGTTSGYFLADGQGSTRLLTDSTGTATDSTVYTAFGETLFSSGSTPNDFKYVSEQADPNAQFYYLRERWMNPTTGRFASIDPYDGDPESPISLHRYLYANSSPASFTDPTGEFSLTEAVVTFAVSSILTQVAQVTFFRWANGGGGKELLWKGEIVSATAKIPGAPGFKEGGVYVNARTKDKDGKNVEVDYVGFILSASIPYASKTIGPIGFSIGTFSVTTPPILGTKHWALGGAISWIGGNAGIVGSSKFFMGFGKGTFKLSPKFKISNQFGLSTATGFCTPID